MKQLRSAREAVGLTQAELAIKSGVSQQTISLLELDARNYPRIDTAAKLAAALGCTIDELVNGKEGA